MAATWGHLEVLNMFMKMDAHGMRRLVPFMAAHEGNLAIFKYAHENGCSWNVHGCVERCQPNVIDYVVQNGGSWTVKAQYCIINVLVWAIETVLQRDLYNILEEKYCQGDLGLDDDLDDEVDQT
jgi:hypothetical protein